jgi:hypothetical protein
MISDPRVPRIPAARRFFDDFPGNKLTARHAPVITAAVFQLPGCGIGSFPDT